MSIIKCSETDQSKLLGQSKEKMVMKRITGPNKLEFKRKLEHQETTMTIEERIKLNGKANIMTHIILKRKEMIIDHTKIGDMKENIVQYFHQDQIKVIVIVLQVEVVTQAIPFLKEEEADNMIISLSM